MDAFTDFSIQRLFDDPITSLTPPLLQTLKPVDPNHVTIFLDNIQKQFKQNHIYQQIYKIMTCIWNQHKSQKIEKTYKAMTQCIKAVVIKIVKPNGAI